MSFETASLQNLLPDYYKKIFPFKPYTKWLQYNLKPSEYFNRREFAFILQGDVHLRYKSFGDQLEFEKALCDVAPEKLDLGAVYNHMPKDGRKFGDFKAIERELVFDIDLTDYDGVRKCCSEAKVCKLCWKFVVAAALVLDTALENDFGFQARMWVFSGRRGVHCWIGDEKARKLTNTGRAAVAEYLSLIQAEKVLLYNNRTRKIGVHPVIDDAVNILLKSGLVDEMVCEQKWLEGDSLNTVLVKAETDLLKDIICNKEYKTSSERWNALKATLCDADGSLSTKSSEMDPLDRDFLRWFVLWHVYPRLDVNVSTGVNHLLKSPFCIHPKTGNVAVPLDIKKIREFNVHECPRIDVLIKEIADYMRAEESQENQNNRKILGYRHTSLAPYVENFEKFVNEAIKA